MPNYTREELKRQADEKLANDAAISAAAAKHAEFYQAEAPASRKHVAGRSLGRYSRNRAAERV